MGRRNVSMLLGIALIVSACAGGASSTDQVPVGTPVTGPASASGAGAVSSAQAPPGGGWGSAVIVVGDKRTEFAIAEFGCSAREDDEYAHGMAVDGSDVTFSVTFPLTLADWDSREAQEILVTIDGRRWRAGGPSTEDLASFAGPKVDSLEIAPAGDDPRSFHATGTFLVADVTDLYYSDDLADQVAGTFDITCTPTS